MSFDWDEFEKMTDEEQAAYMERVRDAALKEAEGKTFAPGDLGLEKAAYDEAPRSVGRMMPDGTIHYYTDEEKRARAEKAKRKVEAEKRAKAESARPDPEDEGNPPG
ncbi:hypothetical protein [Jiangella gansuensis]|uniref:hypothetical protein n=1 Tax=Jiangella gansuensis TaxID=281473 RepID=UPI0004BBB055|nr:hypothetical protein [Jiangella gansuensis]